MQVISDIKTAREVKAVLLHEKKKLAFVPTMGCLHEGHLSLIKQAQQVADRVVVSIFVNPLQFGANEDLATYPRTPEQDLKQLAQLGVDYVFTPNEHMLFPNGRAHHAEVSLPQLKGLHCGVSRPQFFDGVATIVTKLFNIVQPDIAVFGEKDYQQLLCIRQLVNDLCLPIEIQGGATVREADGLAMSSRNNYLSPQQRDLAPFLQQTLLDTKRLIEADNRDWGTLTETATARLNQAGFEVDYFNICDAETLLPADDKTSKVVLLAAAWLGKARLIDNVVVG